MPVILLSDQAMAYRTQSVQTPDFENITVSDRDRADASADGYLPYEDTVSGVSPMAIPGSANGMYIATGLEHDETGAPNYTPPNREKMMAKRYRKLETLAEELTANGNGICDVPQGAKLGVIGWGTTEGPILEAIKRIEADGGKVAHIHPKVIMPLPKQQFADFLAALDKVVIFEENYTAQFSSYLKTYFPIEPIEVNKCTGFPFTGDEIYNTLKEHL